MKNDQEFIDGIYQKADLLLQKEQEEKRSLQDDSMQTGLVKNGRGHRNQRFWLKAGVPVMAACMLAMLVWNGPFLHQGTENTSQNPVPIANMDPQDARLRTPMTMSATISLTGKIIDIIKNKQGSFVTIEVEEDLVSDFKPGDIVEAKYDKDWLGFDLKKGDSMAFDLEEMEGGSYTVTGAVHGIQ